MTRHTRSGKNGTSPCSPRPTRSAGNWARTITTRSMEGIYQDAARIADRAVTRRGRRTRFNLDRTHRPAGDQQVDRIPGHVPAAGCGLLADRRRRQHSFRTPCDRSSWTRSIPWLKELVRRSASLVAHRCPDRRRVSRGGMGDQRDASADGGLLSGLHAAGGFRLSAAGGVQHGCALPAGGCARQAGAHDDHGIRLQRGRRGRNAGHRQSARTADCDHHEQLLALQRPVADTDPDGLDLRRRARARRISRASSPPAPWSFVAVLGVALSLVVSWSLSRTVLRGEASAFSLELPPYRPPRILQTLYTSLIDRTVFVLWRAIVFAVPAGVVIWLVANVHDRRRRRWPSISSTGRIRSAC